MRQPQRVKGKPRTQVSHVKSVPAPLLGWNARNALAEMDPMFAVALENWFPGTAYCEIRGGYSTHLNGSGSSWLLTEAGDNLLLETGDALLLELSGSAIGTIKTLMTYNSLTGTNKFFGSTSTGIYDVSTAGSAGASVLARTDGKHQWTMFGDGTNNWLIAPNGVDKIAYYDGSTWTAVDSGTSPALVGLATTEIISVHVFKGRLFFIQKNSLSFWYLPAGAAGGALLEFDLSAECKKGGYLMAMATWTRDGGDGADDVAVFVTSEGEAIVYQGNNPSSAVFWAKVGAFQIGKPLGRRCVTQFGGDCVILTENGTFPMSAAMQQNAIDYKMALSFNIENAFTDAARSYGGNFGWEATVYPAHSALIVNIPISEDGEHEQYVMNTITKAWCKFKEWDAECFGIFNGELYYASGQNVRKAWTGAIDGADNIEAYGKQAFNYLDSKGQLKQVVLYQPMLSVNGAINYLTDVDRDFQDDPISGTATYSTVAGATWDSSVWDAANWASGLTTVMQFTSPAEWSGYCFAGKLKVATNSLTVQWNASNFVYQIGGIL